MIALPLKQIWVVPAHCALERPAKALRVMRQPSAFVLYTSRGSDGGAGVLQGLVVPPAAVTPNVSTPAARFQQTRPRRAWPALLMKLPPAGGFVLGAFQLPALAKSPFRLPVSPG